MKITIIATAESEFLPGTEILATCSPGERDWLMQAGESEPVPFDRYFFEDVADLIRDYVGPIA